MSLHMNCQAAKGFNGYAMQHQTDSKYMYVLTHVWLGKLCSLWNPVEPALALHQILPEPFPETC